MRLIPGDDLLEGQRKIRTHEQRIERFTSAGIDASYLLIELEQLREAICHLTFHHSIFRRSLDRIR